MPQVFLNRTIDDEFGDSVSGALPTYRPDSYWNVGTSCTICEVHPDPTLAFNHTWHDTSQLPGHAPVSVTLDFVGTAIYVFCIAPPITTNVVTLYNLNFTLDGVRSGTFSYSPTSTTDFVYNLSVVSLESLANEPHTLLVSTDDSENGSIFLFDYAVYTTVEGKSSTAVGTIAGCVVGGIFLILLVLAFLFFKRRSQKRKSSQVLPVVDPFHNNSNPPPSSPKKSVVNSRTTLVPELPWALDTVATLQPLPTPSSPSSRYPPGWSESRYDTPPPVYLPN
ncbi:hypothetical protein DFH07DRAFT_539291 [Mycena maculata]|uniref:Epidermal growth factor receptor-like transmembrane-juxtamembrane segment domain-containing protein n=1 Tax=Mycena maculata TaxID=230809 RepID=A0AAD7NWI1_9AGAR|nr:hypothetical protein DFH07DRAFT_539291 [Mycena maculata]